MIKILAKFVSVELEFNKHIVDFEDLREKIHNLCLLDSGLAQESEEILEECIKRDTLIELNCWTSSVGHYDFYGHDFDELIKRVEDLIDKGEIP